jgi:hypothetical protein
VTAHSPGSCRRRFFRPPESQVEVVSVYHQEQEFSRLSSATPAA